MFAEGDDLVPPFIQGVVNLAQGRNGSTLGSPEDASQPELHVALRWRVEDVSEFLLDLVRPCERPVAGQDDGEVGALGFADALPCTEQQPAFATPNAA